MLSPGISGAQCNQPPSCLRIQPTSNANYNLNGDLTPAQGIRHPGKDQISFVSRQTSMLSSVTQRWPSKWPHALQKKVIPFPSSQLHSHQFIFIAFYSLTPLFVLQIYLSDLHTLLKSPLASGVLCCLENSAFLTVKTRSSSGGHKDEIVGASYSPFLSSLGFSSVSVVSLQSHIFFWYLSCSVQHPFYWAAPLLLLLNSSCHSLSFPHLLLVPAKPSRQNFWPRGKSLFNSP